jgi:hypothetical protein
LDLKGLGGGGERDTKRCASTSSLKNIVLKFCSVLKTDCEVSSVHTTLFIASQIFTYKFKRFSALVCHLQGISVSKMKKGIVFGTELFIL